jgi:hypothetical protein
MRAAAVSRQRRKRSVEIRRRQHVCFSFFKPLGPHPVVAVQPPDSLQQHIHRRKVGYKQIGVDVEALLQCLGANKDQRAAWTFFADRLLHRSIEPPPIGAGEAPVMQSSDLVKSEKRRMIRRKRMERTGGRDSIAHQIAHNQNFRTTLSRR